MSSAMVSSATSFAQQPTLVRRITLILGNSEDDPNGHERLKLFRDSLRETGWVDGQNAAIKARWLAQNPDRALVHAKEVVQERPDVVVVNGTPGLSALQAGRAWFGPVRARAREEATDPGRHHR